MNYRFLTFNANRVMASSSTDALTQSNVSTQGTPQTTTTRRQRVDGSRAIFIKVIDEGDEMYTFRATSLRQVFTKLFEYLGHYPYYCHRLYWNYEQVDPELTFSHYGMGDPIYFVAERVDMVVPREIRHVVPELYTDSESEPDEDVELRSPILQNGKTFEKIMTVVDEYEPFVKLIEDLCCLIYQLKSARNITDGSIAIGCFIRSTTGRANVYFYRDIIERFYKDFVSAFSLQSDGHWTNTVSDMYENYSRCKDSEMSRRLKTFFNHLIMHCVYFKLGIEVDPEVFKKLEKNKVRPNLLHCLTFFDATVSLLTFLLKQGRQVMLTGNVEHFFIDSDTLSQYTVTAKRLKMQSEFLGNPAAINLELHTFLKELSQCIADGKALSKYIKATTIEGRFFYNIHMELQAIENRYLTVTASQSIRKAPLGFIIYGQPGIGKSSVMKIIADFDARRRGRNPDPSYIYTFPSDSEYLDNFRSNMHTVIIDDAAIHNPAKIQGIDPTLKYIMRINNGIAWNPPQAEIELKGKTPMLNELSMISSNVFDINIPIYYQASYAAMRRLMYNIEPKVKPEYAHIDMVSLDSSKCFHDTNYPDYWTFRISKATRKDKMRGEYVFEREITSMKEFLHWLGEVSDKHNSEQELWLNNNKCFDVMLCDKCLNPSDMCLCSHEVVQVYRVIDGEPVYCADHPQITNKDKDESDFIEKFLIRNGNLDLFKTIEIAQKPWRDRNFETSCKRLFKPEMSKTFVKKMEKDCELLYLDYYAYEILPTMITTGWSNGDILHDFYNYCVFVKEHTDINDLLNVSDVFTQYNITIPSGNVVGGFLDTVFKMLVSLYFYSSLFRQTCRFFGKYHFIRSIALKFLRPCLLRAENQKYFATKLGRKIDDKLGGNSTYVKYALGFLSLGAVASLAYGFWSKFNSKTATTEQQGGVSYPNSKTKLRKREHRVSDNSISDYQIEDNVSESSEVSSVGYIGDNSIYSDTKPQIPLVVGPKVQALRNFGEFPKPAPGDNRVNMWSVEDRAVTSVDFVPDLCRDLVGFEKKMCRNVLVFETFEPTSGGAWKLTGLLTVLSNEHFLTNSHSIPKDIDVKFIVYLGRNHLVCPKIEFVIKQNQIERVPNRDIAIVRTRNLPALFNDISRNFVRASYNGVYDGFYLIKRTDGSLERREVLNIKKCHLTRVINGIYFDMEMFQGKVAKPTELGDCGSPLIAITGYGPVIVGFHAILDEPNLVYSSKFCYEDFIEFSKPMLVQVGKIPIGDIEVYQAPKSYIDFHPQGTLMYHGELKVFRTRPKHTVVSSELASQIYGKTLCGFLMEERLCAPVMDSWRAQQTGLKEFLDPVKDMDESVLIEIADIWVKHILSGLSKEELDLIQPYCIDAAVNGVPGMAYVDSIKRSTSMGFPYFKTKKAFLLTLESDHWPDGVRFTPDVEKRIAEWMELLREGIRIHAVFSSNLKNEAVSFKKFLAWKTRIFFSCPAELLVIVRMFYLGFSRVVQRNRELFWVAIGLNTTSPEWDDLFHILAKFGVDTTIAGDHVYYDKKVKMLVMHYVMDAINRVCIASGNFTEEMQLMMEVLKYELMNPTVDFFGMLITLLGGEVSGHQLTTIFNCVLNVFYLMYAYKMAGYELSTFFDFVVGVILGDDHVLCVSPERPLYHHTHIKDVLEGIGLGYTMADKTSESRPYISLYDAPFLKRNFVYDKALGVHVAKLEFNSIAKMMTIQVKSKTIMQSAQLAQALCSAASEMFLYGEECFDEFINFINKLDKSPSLVEQMREYPILSYEAYKIRFWKSVPNKEAYSTGLQSQKSYLPVSYCLRQTSILHSRKRVGQKDNHARAFPEIRIYGSMELDTQENCKVDEIKLALQHENNRLSKTNEQLNAIQSDIPMTMGSESSTSQQTQFVNETPAEVMSLSVPHDMTANSLITQSHLAEYLSRPTKIHTFVWTENASAGNIASINPWNLFFNNANIRNKLEGFGYIRCNLHLKFTINASQFYYGSIGAFYTPMSGYVQDTTGSTYGYAPGFQVLQSQKPHVWLDPQTTSSAVLELPFLFNRHFLNATSLVEFTNMGKIDFTQFAALRSANGVTTTGVNIVTYAWATDLEMTALTSAAVLQSKREYVGNGQISGPASTVANVAKRMADLPVIGPFAKATEMASGAVAGIASMFGFTNVPNVHDVEPMKPLSFHTLASSEISEPINKLSLQPKQEISIDSSYAGDVGKDQMHITNFCQRESFLCGSLWATTTGEDGVLFTSHVTPQLYEKSSGTNFHIYSVPMAHISALFNYWRGDLIFRFKVIKTQYHRGRLAISWDPLENDMSAMPGYGNPRVQNIIFDLEDTDQIEVRVPYMQQLPFVRCRDGSGTWDGPWWSNGGSPTLTAGTGLTNGTLQVRVVNRLTAPEASSDVDLLVFVRAADNIEFACPADIRDKTMMTLQSKREFVMGNPSISDPMTYSEVFGEKITSLRQLLHRQSKTVAQVIPRTADWEGSLMYANFPFQRTPKPYGYTVNGSEIAYGTLVPGSTFGFNYVRVHPITWVQACFVGTKGSTNWTFNVLNNDGKSTTPVMSIGVCRTAEISNNKASYTVIPGTLGTYPLMRENNCIGGLERQGAQGMALTNQYTQSGVSVNLPYYSRYKFLVNNQPLSYSLSDDTSDERNRDWFVLTVKRGVVPETTDADIIVDTYVGTGPDFDLVFFLNCPVWTYLQAPSALTSG